MQSAIERLVEEFYSVRQKPGEGHVLLEHGRLRTASPLYDKFFAAALTGNDNALSGQGRERLHTLLPLEQAEMQAFIDFLKDKFFEKAQEK